MAKSIGEKMDQTATRRRIQAQACMEAINEMEENQEPLTIECLWSRVGGMVSREYAKNFLKGYLELD